MINLELLPAKFISFRDRWTERNVRMDRIIDAVNGEYDEVADPDDDEIKNRSPNFIQVALEDTAESASIIPTVRVKPAGASDEQIKNAAEMERYGVSYFDTSKIETLNIRELMDLAGFGVCAALVHHDEESGGPLIQWRDPRTCFPEPGFRTMDSVREVMFARSVYLNQLPEEWREKVRMQFPDDFNEMSLYRYHDKEVILVEHFTEEEWLIAALYQAGINRAGGVATLHPVELDRGMNANGICPVVLGQRLSLDNEPRGQFDQLIGMMRAHIRLQGLVLDYADQAVYSDIFVKDLIGPLNFGGGAYIQLGPNGDIGRVQPATTDLSVFRDIDQLVSSMHLAGRYPQSRPGEIDQSIASAKFLEATAALMNTVIRTYHLIMGRFWEQVLRLCFVYDKAFGRKRMVHGVLRNQQFSIERDPAKIDLDAKVNVEYGLGLGHDPAQAMVLGIQAKESGFVSTEFVQENFEGINDVELERQRIDVERLRDMAFAQLLQMLEGGQIPRSALGEIARARRNGEDIFELFDKFVVKPAEEQQAAQLVSGVDGQPIQQGAPPGVQVPPAPGAEELLGSLGIGGGEGPDPNSRLNVPLGGGSFASTNL